MYVYIVVNLSLSIYIYILGIYFINAKKIILDHLYMESFSRSKDISTISSSHYSNRKATGHCSMVRFKEECPPHRIDCPLGRKPRGSTRAKEKPLRDTACHVIPIEVGCRGFLGHSVISFLSKIGITGRSVKSSNRLQTTARYALSWIWSKARKFSAWRKYTRNHLSRVIT